MLYAAVFVIALNILIYTYGVSVMRRIPDEERAGSYANIWSKLGKVFHIGVAACILALLIYLSGLQVPGFLQKTAGTLEGLTAPLSMLVIGASLGAMALKSLMTNRKLIVFVLVRLLAVPAIGLLIIGRFIRDDLIMGVCMVMLAGPVASMTTMLARQYGGDYELTAKGVALSTILSVVTMPLIQMIF